MQPERREAVLSWQAFMQPLIFTLNARSYIK